jgi:hypothetical protein
MNEITINDLAKDLTFKKMEKGLYRAFKMDFSYVPVREKSLIKLNGASILSTGNVSVMIAPPGSGKSNVVEAAASGALNPECDSLGFMVDSEKTLLVDTERVFNDLRRGLDRIQRRTGLSEEAIMAKLDVFSFIEMDSIQDSKTELEFMITQGGYELIIIDGSADFVLSVNDEQESKSFWKWLISLANKKHFGALLTIHPNPEDPQGKATGHLGSQGQKKAESVFNIFKAVDDKKIREISTHTPHGKVRNAADGLYYTFTWNDNQKMFVSCDAPKRRSGKKDFEDIFKDLFEEKVHYSYAELRIAYMKLTKKSDSTAKRDIKSGKELGTIFENGGLYYFNNNHAEDIPGDTEPGENDQLPF